MPTSGVFGTGATDFFCAAVATGSKALDRSCCAVPVATVLFLARARGARWSSPSPARPGRPAAPLRLARRRTWGQILSAAARMYVRPAAALPRDRPAPHPARHRHHARAGRSSSAGSACSGSTRPGRPRARSALLVVAIGTTLALLGLGLVQAATACALVEIDAGRPVGPSTPTGSRSERIRPLLGGDRALRRRLGAC